MNSLFPLIVLILLSIISVSLQQVNQNKIILIFLFIISVLYLCLLDKREKFVNYAPINNGIGCYSNLKLGQTTTFHDAMKYDELAFNNTTNIPPLVSDVTIFTPIGEGVKLKTDIDSYRHPSNDGTYNTPKNMFMFTHNQCRPECCPSPYTCSNGCICVTKNQKKFIKGTNKKQLAPGDCRMKF